MKERYFVELSFKGTQYHGWQIQDNALSVQEKLNHVFSVFFREPVETIGCGRTDTGVHARQFYAHFDISQGRKEEVLSALSLHHLNAMLPWDIALKRFIPVHPEAHARFDALSRSYEYFIHLKKNPFKIESSYLHRKSLDVESMNKAAALLKQFNDFGAFSKSRTQVKTNICTIKEAYWEILEDGICFRITADRFLRNMVRAIVGTLLEIGEKKIKEEELISIIQSKSRTNAGMSVPACGLYLTKVVYPYIHD